MPGPARRQLSALPPPTTRPYHEHTRAGGGPARLPTHTTAVEDEGVFQGEPQTQAGTLARDMEEMEQRPGQGAGSHQGVPGPRGGGGRVYCPMKSTVASPWASSSLHMDTRKAALTSQAWRQSQVGRARDRAGGRPSTMSSPSRAHSARATTSTPQQRPCKQGALPVVSAHCGHPLWSVLPAVSAPPVVSAPVVSMRCSLWSVPPVVSAHCGQCSCGQCSLWSAPPCAQCPLVLSAPCGQCPVLHIGLQNSTEALCISGSFQGQPLGQCL